MSAFTAFFAYPAEPHDLRTTIEAVSRQVAGKRVRLKLWAEMDVFGANIPDEVRTSIQKSGTFFADLTRPNLNVYYELGYAIGLGKKVGPVVNSGFEGAVNRIRREALLDNIGFKQYHNSSQLAAIVEHPPVNVLTQLYAKEIDFEQPLYFIDTVIKTDFRNTVVSAIKESKVFFRSFDPIESSRISAIQLIGEITASAGIVIPLLSTHIVSSEEHNLKAAFVAGLSHGLGRKTLLIANYGDDNFPADYRDDVFRAKHPKDIVDEVVKFAHNVVADVPSLAPSISNGRSVALRTIQLGATAAENEFRRLAAYFVETAEFQRTVRGEVKVVTGRKGSGKTAIFFRSRDVLRNRMNTIVIDLKPESHQLIKFKEQLSGMLEKGVVDHTLAAFWYYVIMSEILVAILRSARGRARNDSGLIPLVRRVEEALGAFNYIESGDFSSRLNRLASFFLQEINSAKGETRLNLQKMTNIVYAKAVPEIRDLIVESSSLDTKIVVLFDNIDKGWPASGLERLDVRVVRLVIDSLTKIEQDLEARDRAFQSTVFLRNDIYEILLEDTSDRGKDGRLNIDWTDREKLKQVIRRRLEASQGGAGLPFEQLWNSRFAQSVNGVDSFSYFIEHCLMRPRFLIGVIESAISNAINRGHAKVEEQDCIIAVRQHAYTLLDDFGFEIQDVSGLPSDLLYSFVGAKSRLSRAEILAIVARTEIIGDAAERAFNLMLWYGVLGIQDATSQAVFIYDVEYKMRRLEAEMRRPEFMDIYVINPAIFAALQ